MILRGIRRRHRRAVLTVAGVCLGAAMYMVLVASAEGFLDQFRGLVTVFDSQIVVQQESATSPWSSLLSPAQVAAVSRIAGVDGISRVAMGKTRLRESSYFLVFGLDPGEHVISRLPITSGRSVAAGSGEMMLGERAARRLGLGLGHPLEVRRMPFRIVGLYRTGNAILDSGAVIGLQSLQERFNLGDRVNLLFLLVQRAVDREKILAGAPDDLPGMEAATADSWVDVYGQMEAVEHFARFLALVALLVSAMGVANSVHVRVSEQSRELAILRALGWGRWRVARLVLMEGALLAAVGGLVAIPVAAAVLHLVGSAPSGRFDSSGLLPFTLGFRPAAEGWALAVLAGVAGTAAPLARVLRIETARVLREY
jgi:putative ABC transport system permease protein